MFRRVRKEETPNRLSDEAEPNKLSLDDESRPNELDLDSGEYDDELDEDEEQLDPEERARQAAELQAELQRQAEEFGLTRSDPQALYGPNGQAVAELLDSLGDVDDDTAESIADAYWSVPEADRKVARSVVSRRHRGGDLELELQAAERAVADWLNALEEEGVGDVYTVVAEAATDAVDALVLDDKLADIDFDTLYGPWGDVMDSEEDDEAEGEDEEELPEAVEAALDKVDAARAEEAEVVAEEGQFGPNDALVMVLLDKLAGLSGAEISELVAAWRRQPKEKLKVAHRNLQDLTEEDPQWREQLRLAQEEVFAWMAGHAGEGRLDYSIAASSSTPEVRRSAGPVAADAVAALVMADILEPGDAVTLYAPWAEVVGTPELPEYEDEGEGEEGEPE
jgi:hypothetical protein